jgi:hypothetical protein
METNYGLQYSTLSYHEFMHLNETVLHLLHDHLSYLATSMRCVDLFNRNK